MELHHEIEQFLFREAWLLDNEMMREWLNDLVAPDITYRVVMTEERFRRDKSEARVREVMPYDDIFPILELRVRQFETDIQAMMDPPQRILRAITNIRAFHGATAGEFKVFSYGLVSRFRRQYESEKVVFSREDLLRRDDSGALRIASRRVDLPERVVRNKNLLFFL